MPKRMASLRRSGASPPALATLYHPLMELPSLNWSLIFSNLLHIGIAYVMALPVAWNREQSSRSAGMRTYPMVAVATCALMLIGIKVMSSTDAEARVMQAVITGMGFIGGGAILKYKGEVKGMATAASLWCTGAIGISVAWQRYEIAAVLSLLTFGTLQLVPSAKKLVKQEREADD